MTQGRSPEEHKPARPHLRNPFAVLLVAALIGGGLLHYTALAAMQQRIIKLENVMRAAMTAAADNDKPAPKPSFDL